MTHLRTDARAIFQAALDRVEPRQLVRQLLSLETRDGQEMLVVCTEDRKHYYPLDRYHTVLVCGYGKASPAMAQGLRDVLGNRIQGGLVVTKIGHARDLGNIRVLEASHPVPDASSEKAAIELMAFAQAQTAGTLVLNCVSGGGSALLCAPAFGLTLADKRAVNELLLASGAPITAVNTVRKHLSLVKGGRLAASFYPATVANLVLSDVMGDEMATVASGPTVHDPTTWAEARAIVRRYRLEGKVPRKVLEVLDDGEAVRLPETPKSAHPAFTLCDNVLAGSNAMALAAAEAQARALGYETTIVSTDLQGDAGDAAAVFARCVLERKSGRPQAFLAGGETTVIVTGAGKGGRNQQMAVAFCQALHHAGFPFTGAFLSGATDGSDGPTDAAGGLVDAAVMEALRPLAESALANNDTYHALETAGGLLKTGPTGTNVCDLQILLLN
jgi:hydroxypyruvate reductase